MRQPYRDLPVRPSPEDVVSWIEDVTQERRVDLEDYENQVSTNPVIFQTVPTSSTDIKGGEKVGDMAVDASYLYVVVEDSGLKWRRVAISTF